MSKRDLYHDAVVNGLKREDWNITHDPFSIAIGDIRFRIDLGAEKVIAAQKGETKIAVEIKSFLNQSPLTDFHEAIGKYDIYLFALEEKKSPRVLFLAIPHIAYEDFFQKPFIQKIIQKKNIKLIVYHPEKQIIVKWIK